MSDSLVFRIVTQPKLTIFSAIWHFAIKYSWLSFLHFRHGHPLARSESSNLPYRLKMYLDLLRGVMVLVVSSRTITIKMILLICIMYSEEAFWYAKLGIRLYVNYTLIISVLKDRSGARRNARLATSYARLIPLRSLTTSRPVTWWTLSSLWCHNGAVVLRWILRIYNFSSSCCGELLRHGPLEKSSERIAW